MDLIPLKILATLFCIGPSLTTNLKRDTRRGMQFSLHDLLRAELKG
jgi:hypothetical protein